MTTTAKLAHSPRQAWELLGLGKTSFYELLKAGTIRPIKCGRRTLIPHAELERFIAEGMHATAKAAA